MLLMKLSEESEARWADVGCLYKDLHVKLLENIWFALSSFEKSRKYF